ncbi:MAG: SGNH/GDSL hydrolase family protein [Solirubrobacterales bacterium]
MGLIALALALAGCGDGGETAPPGPGPGPKGGGVIRVAALGDSITTGSPLWDPDAAIRAQIPQPDESSQFEYWATRAEEALEFRNCGVFGERTDEIALRLEECADGADVLIVQGGINDIAQGRPVEDAAGDLRAMVNRGLQAGLDTYLVDVLPWNNGHPGADEPIAELNRAVLKIGEEEDVEVIGFHDALEDPREPGTMRAELTDDGDHPSVAGYRRLGSLVARRIDLTQGARSASERPAG